MFSPLRIVLVVVGLAAVVYAVASLTGRWLGTPWWWTDDSALWRMVERQVGPLCPHMQDEPGTIISRWVVGIGFLLLFVGVVVLRSRVRRPIPGHADGGAQAS